MPGLGRSDAVIPVLVAAGVGSDRIVNAWPAGDLLAWTRTHRAPCHQSH